MLADGRRDGMPDTRKTSEKRRLWPIHVMSPHKHISLSFSPPPSPAAPLPPLLSVSSCSLIPRPVIISDEWRGTDRLRHGKQRGRRRRMQLSTSGERRRRRERRLTYSQQRIHVRGLSNGAEYISDGRGCVCVYRRCAFLTERRSIPGTEGRRS